MAANQRSQNVGQQHPVAVSVRIRPGGSAVAPAEGGGVTCGGNAFAFPAAVLTGSEQASVDALLSELTRKFIQGGIACTLMAYGQTGSGKTYTMLGPPGSLTEASLEQAAGAVPALWGIFPRAMIALLAAPELAGATFHASAVEIYMEHVYDLLDARKPVKVGSARGAGRGTIVVADMGKAPVLSGHAVIVGGLHPSGCSCFHCFQKTKGLVGPAARRHAASASKTASQGASSSRKGGDEFGTEGETQWPIKSPTDIAKLARLVEAERVAHSHALNDRSSRSHCLIRVQCTHVERGGRSQKRTLLFVDLAGSERIAKSLAAGARQKEAASINQSLTALGRVVKELNERSAHVSYRDSALTMLLRSSFDGPSCTAVVVNVASEEAHAEETICSLRFGQGLSSVRTSAAVAAPTDVGAKRAQVAAELAAARTRLDELARTGQAAHVADDAPREGKAAMTTLRKNIAALGERKAEVRALKAQLAEARAAGDGAEQEVLARLVPARAAHDSLAGIVALQKTIKGLWVPASSAFQRCETQVIALATQLQMLSVGREEGDDG